MQHLFELFMDMRGRYNFVNLSRYGSYCGQSYRNNFVRKLDFLGFNKAVIAQSCWRYKIIASDPSYISKSGKHTDSIGYFAKAGFIDAITGQADLEVISKLRIDADLKYLYNSLREKRRGHPENLTGR